MPRKASVRIFGIWLRSEMWPSELRSRNAGHLIAMLGVYICIGLCYKQRYWNLF
jgi:hypothetical protein